MLSSLPQPEQHGTRPSPFQLGAGGQPAASPQGAERRSEPRTEATTVVLVVPMNGEDPDISRAFAAITRDTSGKGIGVVAHHFALVSDVLICLWTEGEPRLVRAAIRHRKEVSRGWIRFGAEIVRTAEKNEYPELRKFIQLLLS
jgi:hypothetical protein